MSSKRKAQFLRQLGTMLGSGMPVLRSLQNLSVSFPGRLAGVAGQLRESVERGASLHQAVSRQRGLFDPLEVALVDAGERSGRLEHVLIQLAERREALNELRKRILTRLIYPALLLHVAMLAGAVISAVDLNGGGIQVRDGIVYLVKAVVVVYGIGTALYLAYALRWSVPPYARALESMAYSLPLVGRMVQRGSLIRFCQAFEALYVAGVAHPPALTLAAGASGNAVFETRLKRAVPEVANGTDLGEALQLCGAFDPDTVSQLMTGVQSGKIEEALNTIREAAELDARTASDRLAVIVPILLYFGVAIWAAYLIISFYIAYFARISEALNM